MIESKEEKKILLELSLIKMRNPWNFIKLFSFPLKEIKLVRFATLLEKYKGSQRNILIAPIKKNECQQIISNIVEENEIVELYIGKLISDEKQNRCCYFIKSGANY